jgi:tripartite-type tricarboxylate transporter receptor subunit TctC
MAFRGESHDVRQYAPAADAALACAMQSFLPTAPNGRLPLAGNCEWRSRTSARVPSTLTFSFGAAPRLYGAGGFHSPTQRVSMTIERRAFLKTAAALSAAGSLGSLPFPAARAQVPDVARILAGFAPGGTNDVLSRHIAQQIQGGYAPSVVVENRTGAAGQLAISATKQAAPDGRTMLVVPMAGLAIYPFIYGSLPYDPFKDLTPVSLAGVFDTGLAVGPMVPREVKNVPDFLAWAKANPARASCGSPAAGTPQHFMIELLSRAGGVPLVHVPYRGSQPAVMDTVGAQVAAVAAPVGEFRQQAELGKLRVLATATARRGKFTPDVPTFAEQGFKGLEFAEWFAVFLPPKASPELVGRLNAELRKALAVPSLIEGVANVGIEARWSSAEDLAARLRGDTAQWGPVVKSIGFKVDS